MDEPNQSVEVYEDNGDSLRLYGLEDDEPVYVADYLDGTLSFSGVHERLGDAAHDYSLVATKVLHGDREDFSDWEPAVVGDELKNWYNDDQESSNLIASTDGVAEDTIVGKVGTEFVAAVLTLIDNLPFGETPEKEELEYKLLGPLVEQGREHIAEATKDEKPSLTAVAKDAHEACDKLSNRESDTLEKNDVREEL